MERTRFTFGIDKRLLSTLAVFVFSYCNYGTSDVVVKPSANSVPFAAKFKAEGGDAKVLVHAEYGHHPHGVENEEKNVVIGFFAN